MNAVFGAPGAATEAAADNQTVRFLRAVWPTQGLYIVTRQLGKTFRHTVCAGIEEAAAHVKSFDSQDLPTYIACAAFREREVIERRSDGSERRQVRTQKNVRAIKAWYMDLDVGTETERKFGSQIEAIDALGDFCTKTKLPVPLCVNSGRGIHCWWTLTQEIKPEQWKPVAEMLKALCAKHGFKADPAVTADPARVLRPVGTWNRKSNPPRPVEFINEDDAKPVDFEEFKQLVVKAAEKACLAVPDIAPRESPPRNINADFAVKCDFPPCSAHVVADKCAQLRAMRDTRGLIPEPHWYACIQLLCHSVEGAPLIHEWSKGDSRYNHAQTEQKIAQVRSQGLGPTLCTTFESRNPGGCEGCSHRGKISSPVQLGARVAIPSVALPPAIESAQTENNLSDDARAALSAPLIVNLAEPATAAQAIIKALYLTELGRLLHFWQGDFYRWMGSHYEIIPLPDIRELLYRLGSTSSSKVNKKQVDDAVDAFRGYANLSNTVASPSWIGALRGDRDPRSLVPLQNGILDIETGRLEMRTPRLFNTYALPFNYDPNAPSPADWLLHAAQIWEDDRESIELLQEWFGYCITHRTEQQKALLLAGPKRGGKGTIGRVLTALLGSKNVVSPRLASFGREFGLQPLIGKQLALISDARLGPKSDLDAVVENILRITGEDQISIPRKNMTDFTATLHTRIMVLTNEAPRLPDGSGALPSRFLVLQSDKSFYGREDLTLTSRLLGQLPGIFNWALTGLRRLNERGHFHQPAASRELIEQMELLAAPVRAFVEERCDISDPAAEVSVSELFLAWRAWCTENGREHPGTSQTFGRDLKSAFAQIRAPQQRRTDGGARVRCYRGIRLKK